MDAPLDGCLTRTGHGSLQSSMPAPAFGIGYKQELAAGRLRWGSSPRSAVFSSPLSSSTLSIIAVFSRPLTSFGVTGSASHPRCPPRPVPGPPSCVSSVHSGPDFTFSFCVLPFHFWGWLRPRWPVLVQAFLLCFNLMPLESSDGYYLFTTHTYSYFSENICRYSGHLLETL